MVLIIVGMVSDPATTGIPPILTPGMTMVIIVAYIGYRLMEHQKEAEKRARYVIDQPSQSKLNERPLQRGASEDSSNVVLRCIGGATEGERGGKGQSVWNTGNDKGGSAQRPRAIESKSVVYLERRKGSDEEDTVFPDYERSVLRAAKFKAAKY